MKTAALSHPPSSNGTPLATITPNGGGANGALFSSKSGEGVISSRKAQALDLNSVERKGSSTYYTATTANPASSVVGRTDSSAHPLGTLLHYRQPETERTQRPFNLPEAKTYRPSEDEFADPFKYIESIAEEGSQYGIVKIIPPENWNPPFAVDTEV